MCTLYDRVKRDRFIASSFAVHFIARSRDQNTPDFSGQLLYAGSEYNIISLYWYHAAFGQKYSSSLN